MERLKEPYEILEMDDREVVELRITGYDYGLMFIKPFYDPQGHDVKTLRVHVPKEIKPLFPHYWDITAQTLNAQILPVLEAGNYQGKIFLIQKFGVKPRARFSLEVKS